jgi:hypothetical protein
MDFILSNISGFLAEIRRRSGRRRVGLGYVAATAATWSLRRRRKGKRKHEEEPRSSGSTSTSASAQCRIYLCCLANAWVFEGKEFIF